MWDQESSRADLDRMTELALLSRWQAECVFHPRRAFAGDGTPASVLCGSRSQNAAILAQSYLKLEETAKEWARACHAIEDARGQEIRQWFFDFA